MLLWAVVFGFLLRLLPSPPWVKWTWCSQTLLVLETVQGCHADKGGFCFWAGGGDQISTRAVHLVSREIRGSRQRSCQGPGELGCAQQKTWRKCWSSVGHIPNEDSCQVWWPHSMCAWVEVLLKFRAWVLLPELDSVTGYRGLPGVHSSIWSGLLLRPPAALVVGVLEVDSWSIRRFLALCLHSFPRQSLLSCWLGGFCPGSLCLELWVGPEMWGTLLPWGRSKPCWLWYRIGPGTNAVYSCSAVLSMHTQK